MSLPQPMQNSVLRPYLNDVRAWHGYVRFLGLPTIQDNPDTPIDNLFVPPLIAEEAVAPDSDPSGWPKGRDVFSMLKDLRRLVILGDPGGGKTTLLNWLSWLLVSGRVGVIPEWLEGVFPIPLVLRELDLREVESFDNLLDAFLKRPVAEKISGNKEILLDYLKEGKVIVLVDGFDEVPQSSQARIRNALWEGFEKYPDSYFIATSRLVGYEDCPLDHGSPNGFLLDNIYLDDNKIYLKDNIDAVKFDPTWEQKDWILEDIDKIAPEWNRLHSSDTTVKHLKKYFYIKNAARSQQKRATLAYVMPFDNQRIREFAHFWYRLRTFRQVAINDADEFINAVFTNTTILRLARTPQLLTLMALVFRVRAQLPNGRALLYDLISEAYLESIDRSRKIVQDPYPWKEKRRWLARIGFEMQLLRSAENKLKSSPDNKELLIGRLQVLGWIQQAMEVSGYPKDEAFAEDYLNWIARRSGLLLPRGEDLFSFLHLSFQEYFAALYLGEHLSDADWVISQRDGTSFADGDSRVTAIDIQSWASDVRWQEVLIFCFEELAHSPKESRRLSEWIYGKGFSKFSDSPNFLEKGPEENKAELMARVILDPHSGLSPHDKEEAFLALCRYSVHSTGSGREGGLHQEEFIFTESGALLLILSNADYNTKFWNFAEISNIVSAFIMDLSDSFIARIHNWTKLKHVYLLNSPKLDLEVFADKIEMEVLFLSGNISSDLKPLETLTKLSFVYMSGGKFVDLSPLKKLNALNSLSLPGSSVYDLEPLVGLQKLTKVNLSMSQVVNITALSHMTQLEHLDLSDTPLDNLLPLSGLYNLSVLEIAGTKVNKLSPLASLHNLEVLNLDRTAVEDFLPISKLIKLKKLLLAGTKIKDLLPLAGLKSLEWLNLDDTDVKDLAPLAGLVKLSKLYLKRTKINKLTPLARLKNLELIDLTGSSVRSLGPLRHRTQLKVEGFKN